MTQTEIRALGKSWCINECEGVSGTRVCASGLQTVTSDAPNDTNARFTLLQNDVTRLVICQSHIWKHTGGKSQTGRGTPTPGSHCRDTRFTICQSRDTYMCHIWKHTVGKSQTGQMTPTLGCRHIRLTICSLNFFIVRSVLRQALLFGAHLSDRGPGIFLMIANSKSFTHWQWCV